MSGAPSVKLLQRQLARERAARAEAESLLEQKSLELYSAIQRINDNLGRRTNELAESEARSRTLVELVPDAIWVECDGAFAFLNQAAVELFNADHEQRLLGAPSRDWVPHEHREAMSEFVRNAAGPEAGDHRITLQLRRLDGAVLDIELTAAAINFGGASATLLVARDVSERRNHQAEVEYQATHDLLTALPNKLQLHKLLARMVEGRDPSARQAVLFIDLDHFKDVNDSLGHGTGDTLLRIVADRLRDEVGPADRLGRFGGDEFMVLVEDAPSRRSLTEKAEQIRAAISAPISLRGVEHNLACSIGISVAPDDGLDPEALVKRADIAMNHAKRNGRDSHEFFRRELEERVEERLRLEHQLGVALRRGELSLHYQPQVERCTGDVVGLEALIRWRSPVLGNVSPSHFIPVAERCGLIRAIDEWVIDEACAQLREWIVQGVPVVPVSVNISASQFVKGRIDLKVRAALLRHGIDAKWLRIEITESTTMQDPSASEALMTSLKEIGVRLSIDDFGTGYSNLAHLQRFPVDTIKIDRSFIREIHTCERSRALVVAIIRIATILRLQSVAEGVETIQQYRALAKAGCDFMQGFLLYEPLDAWSVRTVLETPPGKRVWRTQLESSGMHIDPIPSVQ